MENNVCTIYSVKTDQPVVDNFFSMYVRNMTERGRAQVTIKHHTRMYNEFVRPLVGHMRLNELSPIVGDHIVVLAKSTATTNAIRAIITFRQLLRFITRCGYRLEFDWRDIEIPTYRIQKPVYAYSPKDIKYIRNFLSQDSIKKSKHSSPQAAWEHAIALSRMRAIFELNLHSGLRISECPPINKADLDWNTNEIHIVNSKTGNIEKVYFNGARKYLLSYLKMRVDDNPALFVTHDGKRITKNGLKSHFRILKAAIKRRKQVLFNKSFASHTLRKTFCTTLIRTPNMDLKSVQKLMRHQSIKTTLNHYVALDEERCAKWHKKIMRRF